MGTYLHPRWRLLFDAVELLEAAARDMAVEARKQVAVRRPRARRGATLRPGVDTPLWNAVVELARPALKRRGAKAILARELGVHRARIGEYFGPRSSMPDAERVLRLLLWLARQSKSAPQQPE